MESEAKLIRDLPKGLLCWYEFCEGKKTLYIYPDSKLDSDYDAIYDLLLDRKLNVTRASVSELESVGDERFDYVVFACVLESTVDPGSFLKKIREYLKDDGKILFGMNNRLGLRYFCGDRDKYTGRSFDGIENYARVNPEDMSSLGGRLYSKEEVIDMLYAAGCKNPRFYAVLPCLEEPQQIYAEGCVPNEELDVRYNPFYDYPKTVFLEEERLYSTVIKNGLFHIMANSYLVEWSENGDFAPTESVTVSMERGRENAMSTIITSRDTVIKKAVFDEGRDKVELLQRNSEYLMAHGVKMVDSSVENGDFVMPYVTGESAVAYFRRLLRENLDLFYSELDRFWNIILHSSEHVPYEEVDWRHIEPGVRDNPDKQKEDDPQKDKWEKIAMEKKGSLGAILKRGYIDLVSLNCFVVDGEFVFFDQEFYEENIPAYTLLWRTMSFIYWNSAQYEKYVSWDDLMKRFGMYEYRDFYSSFSHYYIDKLRNRKTLKNYRSGNSSQLDTIVQNRQRINYSQEDYEKLFVNIFEHADGRELYLFGSGNYARKFISEFGQDYPIKGLIDNNESKWGQQVEGIEVLSPSVLGGLEEGQYKIIICIRNYVAVMRQLDELGLKNYSIYDWSRVYSRPNRAVISAADSGGDKPGKYHVGYVAGVFDVFHIGHVNLLRRAKEQCDYLIVGVVGDEQVMKSKRATPYMPFEDRIEIVRACKYVDEAVEIPAEYGDTYDAYRRYQFDVQFSGSDYENDPDWIRKRDFLREHGSDLVFFPYTQSTSSTKLKKELRESEKQK